MKFRFYIVFFLFSLLVTAQNSTNQDKEGVKNNNGQNNIIINKVDSTYHAGALRVMELNMNARSLRSSFCLSCHDGIFVKAGHTTTNVGNPENIDPLSIFSFNHPVAFEFTSDLAESKHYLNNPYTTPSGLGGTIADDLLVDGRVECITCHDIFFNRKIKKKYRVLNKSLVNSGLCLTCHNR